MNVASDGSSDAEEFVRDLDRLNHSSGMHILNEREADEDNGFFPNAFSIRLEAPVSNGMRNAPAEYQHLLFSIHYERD